MLNMANDGIGKLSIATMTGQLRALGVHEGDIVMVHASLRAIGPVEHRADGVIAALDNAVGATGSVVMLLSAEDPWDWVNARPVEEREYLLTDAPPFDYQRDPALGEVGTLAEVFRNTPGTMVNDHPDARFGVRGVHAAVLLADLPWDHYYGPGSVLERLVQNGGKILRIGADEDTVTALHYAEYLVEIPDKRHVVRHHKVVVDGAAIVRSVTALDDSNGILDWQNDDYFALIFRDYLHYGRHRSGFIGGAMSELIDAEDIVNFGKQWMTLRFCDNQDPRDLPYIPK